ncbi:unnamed protein product, partial [Allacma fusca]
EHALKIQKTMASFVSMSKCLTPTSGIKLISISGTLIPTSNQRVVIFCSSPLSVLESSRLPNAVALTNNKR